jgi:kynurenine 3-monooxygenase
MEPECVYFSYLSMPSQRSQTRKVVVVGAGPVGCLAAMAFAKQGWDVDVLEARPGRFPCAITTMDGRTLSNVIAQTFVYLLPGIRKDRGRLTLPCLIEA